MIRDNVFIRAKFGLLLFNIRVKVTVKVNFRDWLGLLMLLGWAVYGLWLEVDLGLV